MKNIASQLNIASISRYILCVYFLILPLSDATSRKILIAFFVIALIEFVRKRRIGDVMGFYIPYFLFFSISLIGLLYSDNLSFGLKRTESNLLFLGFPLVLLIVPSLMQHIR